jgi:hypothetical protein
MKVLCKLATCGSNPVRRFKRKLGISGVAFSIIYKYLEDKYSHFIE